MDTRRLTLFPITGDDQGESAYTIRSKDNVAAVGGSKRKFNTGAGIVDLELPKVLQPTISEHRVFVPVEDDPERFYQCIYLVGPDGDRPYYLAQEKTLTANKSPYRIVMIRRSAVRVVVGLSKPDPNLLNIISVFQFGGSIFTVFDRPGLSLSEIALCRSSQLGLAQLQTISKGTLSGMAALGTAGFHLHKIDLEDVTISAYDGRIKVGFDQVDFQGPEVDCLAVPFQKMLDSLISSLPECASLAQNKDLSAFTEYAGRMTYTELQQARNSIYINSPVFNVL